MPKYFLFNKEQVGPSSTNTSDTGVGISVISVSADHVSFITATSGAVNIVFNNAGVFDHVDLGEGESLRKTSVTISCNIGEESKLVEQITNFISSPNTNQTVMKFDFVNNTTSFLSADVSSPKSISAKVHNAPEDLKEKYILYNPTGLTSHIVNGIQFTEDTYPVLDLDAADPANFSGLITAGLSAGTFEYWNNSSQLSGATAYKFAPAAGASADMPLYTYQPDAADWGFKVSNGLKTRSVYMGPDDNANAEFSDLVSDAIVTVSHDYTIYFAIGIPNRSSISDRVFAFAPLYGSSGLCYGPFSNVEANCFEVKHLNGTFANGTPAKFKNDNTDKRIVEYSFPDKSDPYYNRQTCYVFIVRRDVDYNIFFHNHEGDLVGFIPANVGGADGTGGRTDGALSIEHLGAANVPSPKEDFFGHLARFGVIQKDIGSSEASRLAVALYERYNPDA